MINSFDLFFFNHTFSSLNFVWIVVSLFFNPKLHLALWTTLACVCVQRRYSKRALGHCLHLLLLTVCIMFVCGVTKIGLGRARPFLLHEGISGFYFFSVRNAYLSMPSSHAAIAYAVSYFFKKTYNLHYSLFLFCILVLIARISLHQHFASDTLAGIFIGFFVTKFYYKHLFVRIDTYIKFVKKIEGIKRPL